MKSFLAEYPDAPIPKNYKCPAAVLKEEGKSAGFDISSPLHPALPLPSLLNSKPGLLNNKQELIQIPQTPCPPLATPTLALPPAPPLSTGALPASTLASSRRGPPKPSPRMSPLRRITAWRRPTTPVPTLTTSPWLPTGGASGSTQGPSTPQSMDISSGWGGRMSGQ